MVTIIVWFIFIIQESILKNIYKQIRDYIKIHREKESYLFYLLLLLFRILFDTKINEKAYKLSSDEEYLVVEEDKNDAQVSPWMDCICLIW